MPKTIFDGARFWLAIKSEKWRRQSVRIDLLFKRLVSPLLCGATKTKGAKTGILLRMAPNIDPLFAPAQLSSQLQQSLWGKGITQASKRAAMTATKRFAIIVLWQRPLCKNQTDTGARK